MFERCQAIVDATLSHFLADPAVKFVVFAVRGGLYSVGTDRSDTKPGGELVRLPPETRQRVLYDGYSSAIGRVERAGKRFLLVLDNPELDFEPHYCVTRLATAKLMGNQCAIARHTVDERQRDYRGVVQRLQREHPQLTVFDPVPLLCDSRRTPRYPTHTGV